MLLAIALLGAPVSDADDSKAAFNNCIRSATIDTLTAVTADCLKRYRNSAPMPASPDSDAIDPIARSVADDQADKYTLLLTAKRYDPTALCVQAGVTALAYLDAKMIGRYDSWKATERRACAEAYGSGRK